MTRNKKKIQMWVAPKFHKKLKKRAAGEGLDMISLTEKLAEDLAEDDIFEPITKTFKRIL